MQHLSYPKIHRKLQPEHQYNLERYVRTANVCSVVAGTTTSIPATHKELAQHPARTLRTRLKLRRVRVVVPPRSLKAKPYHTGDMCCTIWRGGGAAGCLGLLPAE